MTNPNSGQYNPFLKMIINISPGQLIFRVTLVATLLAGMAVIGQAEGEQILVRGEVNDPNHARVAGANAFQHSGIRSLEFT